MAKNASNYFDSDEVKFFPALLQKSFQSVITSKESLSAQQVKLVLTFLDLINLYLSSSSLEQRRYLIYYLKDQHVVVRCKLSKILKDDNYLEFRESFNKRYQELRHYMNFIEEAEETKESHKTLMDQKFYKKVSLLHKICFKYFQDSFIQITS